MTKHAHLNDTINENLILYASSMRCWKSLNDLILTHFNSGVAQMIQDFTYMYVSMQDAPLQKQDTKQTLVHSLDVIGNGNSDKLNWQKYWVPDLNWNLGHPGHRVRQAHVRVQK